MKFEKIDLTIGIPTCNRDKFIIRAVKSALHQKNCNVEVIVCDNSDNDNTEQLLKKYCLLTNFKYIRNEFNLGPVANYNKCLENASGKYFMLLGDDDWLSPNYASEIANNCLGNDVIFLGKCITVDMKGNKLSETYDENYTLSGEEYIKLLLNSNKKVKRHAWFMLCALTESLKKMGGFYNTQEAQHSDNILLFKIALGRHVFYNPKAIYYYTVYPQSYGNRNIFAIAISSMQFYNWWVNEFEQKLQFSQFTKKDIMTFRRKLIKQLITIYFKRVVKYGPENNFSRISLILLFPYKSWFLKIIDISTVYEIVKYMAIRLLRFFKINK